MSTADPGAEELNLAADTDLSTGTIEGAYSDESPADQPTLPKLPPDVVAKRLVSGRYRGLNGDSSE